MKKAPTPEKINLPYTSTAASFYGDQGEASGNSFLGRLYSGARGRQQVTRNFAPGTAPGAVAPGGAISKAVGGTKRPIGTSGGRND